MKLAIASTVWSVNYYVRIRHLLLCFFVALALASCNSGSGGGDNGGEDTPNNSSAAAAGAPVNVQASVNERNDVALEWDYTGDALYYQIFRSNSNGDLGDAIPVGNRLASQGPRFTRTDEDVGIWYYRVVACSLDDNSVSCSGYSGVSERISIAPTAPYSLQAEVDGTNIRLSWQPVTGATSYEIYRNDSDSTTDALDIGTLSDASADVTADVGIWYFWVRACAGDDNCSDHSRALRVAVAPDAPVGLEVSNSGLMVTLSWEEVEEAAYYEIYRNDSDSPAGDPIASPIALDGTSYNDTVNAGMWYYWIKACLSNGVACSDYSSSVQTRFLSGFNDTGIDQCTGRNPDDLPSLQDCSHGRDSTQGDNTADGHAGFSFTRIKADGTVYNGSGEYSTDAWGCVRDNVTGLLWEVKTNGGIHGKDRTFGWNGWSNLVDASNRDSLCRYSDWRLPTPDELVSIANFGESNPAIDTNYFPNTDSLSDSVQATGGYWTSLTASNTTAWIVLFSFGGSNPSDRWRTANLRRVRLVRGTRLGLTDNDDWANNRYRVHDNGTVTDTITGLMWKRCLEGPSTNDCTDASADTMSWSDALRAAGNSIHGGHIDWRLPNVKELFSLAAKNRRDPAINRDIFPAVNYRRNSSHVWTSSPVQGFAGRVWVIYFLSGDSGNIERTLSTGDNKTTVRLVRTIN